MADVTKTTASLATVQPGHEHHLNGLVAGEDLETGDFVHIKSDGKVWKASGAAANAAAKVRGVVLQNATAGDGVSVHSGIVIRYAANLTPGAEYFLSANAGKLADAASTGGTVPIAFAVDTTRIKVHNL